MPDRPSLSQRPPSDLTSRRHRQPANRGRGLLASHCASFPKSGEEFAGEKFPEIGCEGFRCRCEQRFDGDPSVQGPVGGSAQQRTQLRNLSDIDPYPWRSEHLPGRDDRELVTEEERRRGSCYCLGGIPRTPPRPVPPQPRADVSVIAALASSVGIAAGNGPLVRDFVLGPL